MSLTFLRRKALGAGSIKGMVAYLRGVSPRTISAIRHIGEDVSVYRNDKLPTTFEAEDNDWLVRWGCTASTGFPYNRQINTPEGIKRVNNKKEFREVLSRSSYGIVPPTIFDHNYTAFNNKKVLRPATHAQGRNLWVVNNLEELLQVVHRNRGKFLSGWYASDLINKTAEYRVYVVSGKVATVAEKTPDDRTRVAWNVAQGGRFDVVRWDNWPLQVCQVALEAFSLSGLDFGGVDVMVDEEGRAYVIEINSAPSLPLLSDGSISYRQTCMAKCFTYIKENGKQLFELPSSYNNWRDVIHPAIWSRSISPSETQV